MDNDLIRALAVAADPHFLNARQFLEGGGFDLGTQGPAARSWCEAMANNGDVQAQYVLSELLSFGLFGPRDSLAAFEWCQRAAAAKLPPAMLLLAQMYASGGTSRGEDKVAAENLMREASDMGYAPAFWLRATSRLTEARSAADREAAILLLRNACQLNYAPAEVMLAGELLDRGDENGVREGIALMHVAAEHGDAGAHDMLGYFYHSGRHGLPRDSDRSAFHHEMAEKLRQHALHGLP